MPRSLYGRAALILMLPVVVLQLVVTIVFMQRHFEGVTMQMSTTVAREVELVLSGVPETTLDVLDIKLSNVSRDTLAEPNTRLWYDFSGVIITRNLTKILPQIKVIDLFKDDFVRLVADVDGQAKEIVFDRGRISAAKPHQLFVNMMFYGFLFTLIALIYYVTNCARLSAWQRQPRPLDEGATCRFHQLVQQRCVPRVLHLWICATELNAKLKPGH